MLCFRMMCFLIVVVAALLPPVTALEYTCDAPIQIGNETYSASILARDISSPYGRIVETEDGTLFYRTNKDFVFMMLKPGESTPIEVKGLSHVEVDDCIMDNDGNILIATTNGIYKLDRATLSISYVMAKGVKLLRISIAYNGTIFVTNNYNRLIAVNDTVLADPLELEYGVVAFALNNEGDLYTGNWRGVEDNFYLLKSTANEPVSLPTGELLYRTHVMEVSRNDNFVHYGTDKGLYHIDPSKGQELRPSLPSGDRPVVCALGLGSNGVIYMGTTDNEIIKMDLCNNSWHLTVNPLLVIVVFIIIFHCKVCLLHVLGRCC